MKLVENYSDTEVIEMLREEHVSDLTIKFVYRNYYKGSSIYIMQNQGSRQDAEDIFQEVVITFIELVKNGKFRGESSVKTFMYSLCRFTWLNELKRRGRALVREEKFENTKSLNEKDVSFALVERETKSQIMEILDSLGEVCKKILVAYYYDNLTMKEILPLVDFQNEQVLRNKKYKCLKSIEQMLTADPQFAVRFKKALSYGQ